MEFALVLPQILLVLVAVVEFGWVVFNYTQLYNGLREGLRYGSVPSFSTTPAYKDCSGIRAAIKNTAPQLGIADSEIDIQYDPGNYSTSNLMVADCKGTGGMFEFLNGNSVMQSGDRVVIAINHQEQFLTAIISTFAPNGFNINFTAARSIFS